MFHANPVLYESIKARRGEGEGPTTDQRRRDPGYTGQGEANGVCVGGSDFWMACLRGKVEREEGLGGEYEEDKAGYMLRPLCRPHWASGCFKDKKTVGFFFLGSPQYDMKFVDGVISAGPRPSWSAGWNQCERWSQCLVRGKLSSADLRVWVARILVVQSRRERNIPYYVDRRAFALRGAVSLEQKDLKVFIDKISSSDVEKSYLVSRSRSHSLTSSGETKGLKHLRIADRGLTILQQGRNKLVPR
ncbi:hypothetical protein RRG08_058928 [Elysia crispata]|uniref:Uncharacterized protein n=1 Tax=Elysia crispata TaxID=231223 RepID=A0AAE0XRJ5_9GAST|nr:hypothetical protein RRG08_058928 [Elysia crispata]